MLDAILIDYRVTSPLWPLATIRGTRGSAGRPRAHVVCEVTTGNSWARTRSRKMANVCPSPCRRRCEDAVKLQLVSSGGNVLAGFIIIDCATQVGICKANGPQVLGDRKVEYPFNFGLDGVQGARSDPQRWDAGFFDEVSIGLDDYRIWRTTQIDYRKRLSPPPTDAASERVAVDRGVPLERALHGLRGHCRDAFGQGSLHWLAPWSTSEAFNNAEHFFEPAFA